jgi:hypothetical protein
VHCEDTCIDAMRVSFATAGAVTSPAGQVVRLTMANVTAEMIYARDRDSGSTADYSALLSDE